MTNMEDEDQIPGQLSDAEIQSLLHPDGEVLGKKIRRTEVESLLNNSNTGRALKEILKQMLDTGLYDE